METRTMMIQVLGSGCANCNRLEATVREVVAEVGADAHVEKVTDVAQIMAHGIMSTPALLIDGQTVCAGRVPAKAEVNTWVADAWQRETG
jgi:small redox-active disulfide protein 2